MVKSQDTFLFPGTIAENIALGKPGATRAEIIDAARQANAHEFIRQLPDGYDHILTERGGNLSGGQRQRHRHRPGNTAQCAHSPPG